MNQPKGSDTKEEWSFFYKDRQEIDIFPINLSKSVELINFIYKAKLVEIQEDCINDVIYKPIADKSAVKIQKFYHENKSKFSPATRSTIEVTNEKSKFAGIFSDLIKPQYTRPQLEYTYQDYIDKNLDDTINLIREEINKQKKEESKESNSSSPFESSNGKFTSFDDSNFSSKEGQPVDDTIHISKSSRGDMSADGFGDNSDFGNDGVIDDGDSLFVEKKNLNSKEAIKEQSEHNLKDKSNEKLNGESKSDIDRKEFISDDDEKGFGDEDNKGFGDDDNKGFGDDDNKGFGDEDKDGFGDEDNKGFGDDDNKGFGDEDNKGFGDDDNKGFGDEDKDGFGDSKFSNDLVKSGQKDSELVGSIEKLTKSKDLNDHGIDNIKGDKSNNDSDKPKENQITRNINQKSNPFGLSSDSDDDENPFGADDNPFHNHKSYIETDETSLNNNSHKLNDQDNRNISKSQSSDDSFSSRDSDTENNNTNNIHNNKLNISDKHISDKITESSHIIGHSVCHFEENASNSEDENFNPNCTTLNSEKEPNIKTEKANKFSDSEDNNSDQVFGNDEDGFGSENGVDFGESEFGNDNFGNGFGSDDDEQFDESGFGDK